MRKGLEKLFGFFSGFFSDTAQSSSAGVSASTGLSSIGIFEKSFFSICIEDWSKKEIQQFLYFALPFSGQTKIIARLQPSDQQPSLHQKSQSLRISPSQQKKIKEKPKNVEDDSKAKLKKECVILDGPTFATAKFETLLRAIDDERESNIGVEKLVKETLLFVLLFANLKIAYSNTEKKRKKKEESLKNNPKESQKEDEVVISKEDRTFFDPATKTVIKKILEFNYQSVEVLKKILDKYFTSGKIKESPIMKECEKINEICLSFMNSSQKVSSQVLEHFEKKTSKSSGLQSFSVKLVIIDQISAYSSTEESPSSPKNKSKEEITVNSSEKTKRILSPIINAIPFLSQTYGIYHAGVLIDDELFFEWTTNSLITVKKLTTSNAVAMFPLSPISEPKPIETLANLLGNVVQKWNTKMQYNLVSNNCQHFVIDLLKAIDVKNEPEEELQKDFLQSLKKNGRTEMSITLKKKFLQDFSLFKDLKSDEKIIFQNHQEVDNFAKSLLDQVPENKKDDLKSTEEWSLLSQFDEIFWIRFINKKKKEKISNSNDAIQDLEKNDFGDSIKQSDLINDNSEYSCLKGKNGEILCPFVSNQSINLGSIQESIIRRNEELNKNFYKFYSKKSDDDIKNLLDYAIDSIDSNPSSTSSPSSSLSPSL